MRPHIDFERNTQLSVAFKACVRRHTLRVLARKGLKGAACLCEFKAASCTQIKGMHIIDL